MGDEADQDKRSPWSIAGAIAMLVLFVLIIWWGFEQITPAEDPKFNDPGWLETVLANRWLIGALRLGVISAVAYGVISVVALVVRGQWLSAAGPFKVGESVRAINRERDELAEALEEARRVIEDLSEQLERATERLSASDGASNVGTVN